MDDSSCYVALRSCGKGLSQLPRVVFSYFVMGLCVKNAMQPTFALLPQMVLENPREPPPFAGTGKIAASKLKLPSPGGTPAQEATECVLRVVPPGNPVGMSVMMAGEGFPIPEPTNGETATTCSTGKKEPPARNQSPLGMTAGVSVW